MADPTHEQDWRVKAMRRVAELEAEVEHWKANHDSQVGRKREAHRLLSESRERNQALVKSQCPSCDERMRVNVGLVVENAELRRQLRGDNPDDAAALQEAWRELGEVAEQIAVKARATGERESA